MGPDVTRGAAAGRYVLASLTGRRPIDPIRRVTSRSILERHYPELPEAAQQEVDVLRAIEMVSGALLASWAWRFVDAYTDGWDVLPARSGGTIPRADRSGWTTMELALAAVIDSGRDGITANQICVALNLSSDGISGSLVQLARGCLVQLAQAGVVARLARAETTGNPITPDEEADA